MQTEKSRKVPSLVLWRLLSRITERHPPLRTTPSAMHQILNRCPLTQACQYFIHHGHHSPVAPPARGCGGPSGATDKTSQGTTTVMPRDDRSTQTTQGSSERSPCGTTWTLSRCASLSPWARQPPEAARSLLSKMNGIACGTLTAETTNHAATVTWQESCISLQKNLYHHATPAGETTLRNNDSHCAREHDCVVFT